MDEDLYKENGECRLCLSKDKLCDIFFVRNKRGVSWADMVMDCLSLDVSREDGLPPWLCKKCSTKVNSFFIFKAKCKQTVEKLLKHIVLEPEPEIKIENYGNSDFSLNFINQKKEQSPTKEESCTECEIKIEQSTDFSLPDDNDFFMPTVHEEEELQKEVKAEQSSTDMNILLPQLVKTKETKCPICYHKFKSNPLLLDHVKSIHFNIKYYCVMCDEYVPSELKHKNIHLQCQWKMCEECGEEFYNKLNYIKHLMIKHEKGKHECECGATFKFDDALKIHKDNNHERLYSCHYCPRYFSRRNKVVEHMNRHISGKVVKPIKKEIRPVKEIPTLLPGQKFCPICKIRCGTKTLLVDHITYRHLGQKYYCEICKKYYNSQIRHNQKSHSSWTECKECKQKFTKKILYLKHIKEIHDNLTEETRHVCHCGAKFELLKYYRKHKYKVHKETEFMCDICSKGFLRKDKMKDHMLSHKRERRFPCTSCDKVFFSREILRKHRKRHITGCFICDYCGKQFKTRSAIFAHITSHDPNYKPHACLICGKGFRRSDHRNIHQKQVHKM